MGESNEQITFGAFSSPTSLLNLRLRGEVRERPKQAQAVRRGGVTPCTTPCHHLHLLSLAISLISQRSSCCKALLYILRKLVATGSANCGFATPASGFML